MKKDDTALSGDVLKLPEQETVFYCADTHIAGSPVGWWLVTAHGKNLDGLEEGTYWMPLFEKPIRVVDQDNWAETGEETE